MAASMRRRSSMASVDWSDMVSTSAILRESVQELLQTDKRDCTIREPPMPSARIDVEQGMAERVDRICERCCRPGWWCRHSRKIIIVGGPCCLDVEITPDKFVRILG